MGFSPRTQLWTAVFLIYIEISFFRISTCKPFNIHLRENFRIKNQSDTIRKDAKPNFFEGSDHRIIFPDSWESLEHNLSSTIPPTVPHLDTTPECAKDTDETTFCEDIPNYPHKLVQGLLSNLQTRFASSPDTERSFFGGDPAPEIAQRFGDAEEERFLCKSVDRIIYPKVGKTKYNAWKFIINDDESNGRNIQGVRIEMCARAGRACDLFDGEISGYVTHCRQKYAYRRMLSLTEDGQAVPESFLMPSACCCAYKRDSRILTNFGQTARN